MEKLQPDQIIASSFTQSDYDSLREPERILYQDQTPIYVLVPWRPTNDRVIITLNDYCTLSQISYSQLSPLQEDLIIMLEELFKIICTSDDITVQGKHSLLTEKSKEYLSRGVYIECYAEPYQKPDKQETIPHAFLKFGFQYESPREIPNINIVDQVLVTAEDFHNLLDLQPKDKKAK